MTEPLEAAAKAIIKELKRQLGPDLIETLSEPTKFEISTSHGEAYCGADLIARAALQALMENVSEKMTGSGLRVLVDHLDYVQNEDPGLCLRAMLTAAMK